MNHAISRFYILHSPLITDISCNIRTALWLKLRHQMDVIQLWAEALKEGRRNSRKIVFVGTIKMMPGQWICGATGWLSSLHFFLHASEEVVHTSFSFISKSFVTQTHKPQPID